MMSTLGDSWSLTKTAFRLIKEDKALLAIPAVAAAASVGLMVLFLLGTVTLFLLHPFTGNALLTLIGFLWVAFYFLLWFVATYFTAALIGAATMKLEGKQPTISDGMAIARAHWKKLLIWSLFAGSVGLLIQVVASRFRGLPGLIIGMVAEAAWGVATYFIIPVLLYEDKGTWQSLKDSAGLFIRNFGRTMVSNFILGVIIGASFFGAVLLGAFGLYLFFSAYVIVGMVLVFAAVSIGIFVILLSSATEGILVAALYRYASTGKIEDGLVHPQYLASQPSTTSPLPSSSRTY